MSPSLEKYEKKRLRRGKGWADSGKQIISERKVIEKIEENNR
ncbi:MULTISPECIES: hypothetical protein [Clostridium]|nr:MULTISPECIES: hypothetical protein [Clostridium]